MSAEHAFPGATAVSRLRVYDWPAADGLCGGSPHAHLLCSEGYVVVGGRGRLQTLSAAGFVEQPLTTEDVVWFTPGVIHRLVNDAGLRIVVIMQNSGLPEAGDAVFTFPPEVLGDAERYAAAASVTDETSAQRRRDLAMQGFQALRDRIEAGDDGALGRFHAVGARLVESKLDEWERRWREGPARVAELTGERLNALRQGELEYLRDTAVLSAAPSEKLGMCGHLHAYPSSSLT